MSDKHDDSCSCCDNEEEILTLTDDEGNETDFVIIEGLEYNNILYLALVEAEHAEDEECEFIILKNLSENNEDVLVSIDDESEFNAVRDLFEKKFEASGMFEFGEADSDIDEE